MARPAHLVRFLRLAGYGSATGCRHLLGEGGEFVTLPANPVQLHMTRARGRMPGGHALRGRPDLRPANDRWRPRQ